MAKAEFYDVVNGLLGKETASGIRLGSRHLGSLMLDGICPSTMVASSEGPVAVRPERLAVVMLERLRRDKSVKARDDHLRSYIVVQDTPEGVRADKAVPKRFMPKDSETSNYAIERTDRVEIGVPAGVISVSIDEGYSFLNGRLVCPVITPSVTPQLTAA